MLELAKDFELVREKYINVIENTPGMEEYARWVCGQHPTDAMLKSKIARCIFTLTTEILSG